MIVNIKVIDIPICHGYHGNEEVENTIKSVFSETPKLVSGFRKFVVRTLQIAKRQFHTSVRLPTPSPIPPLRVPFHLYPDTLVL
jgi:hypothetical protein